ncbi:MAG: DUF664 domain-containing protein [Saprospiraceae bacterium]|jgi:hypothetical protein|nr:DUF664 domain-containing protein [Saprospiraceae bacterium]MBK6477657.1 DUF664 domain-containing protein [Saprospiraceae bacterium]MBK7370995.1 DUF664 domain-containing protein [Saprospiraceae bacterium]MBK7436504.1 DUF664 domain-containing protein [Saprospiraceae bacterium]MBK7609690.1 DUF664 domain-containing protein [Saprospiraceae bacterium]
MKKNQTRRDFIHNTVAASAGSYAFLSAPRLGQKPKLVGDSINLIGPKSGYTAQIGTLISMLDWLSFSVKGVTKSLSVAALDYLHDADSNSIGALMLHVAATEVIYQDITFSGLDDFSPANKERWNVAMELGHDAQSKIKGNPLSYYIDAMDEARSKTKAEMKKRDDKWLLTGETKDWDWNNYCKWFHVAEHFANHRGQITWYSKRLPKVN